jgi:hypothetical protein
MDAEYEELRENQQDLQSWVGTPTLYQRELFHLLT